MQNHIKLGLVVFSSLTVGGVVGFLTTRNVLKEKYAAIAEEEIKSVRIAYSLRTEKDKYLSLDEDPAAEVMPTLEPIMDLEAQAKVRAETEKIINENAYVSPHQEPDPEAKPEVKNVFADGDEVIPRKDVLAVQRDPEVPYLISTPEFMEEEETFNKITLTYFEGDGVLVDESEDPVPDIRGTVGEDNVLAFGYNPEDPDVVYVRNERLHTDFEITKDLGSYKVTVLGMDDSPSTESMRRTRPPRER